MIGAASRTVTHTRTRLPLLKGKDAALAEVHVTVRAKLIVQLIRHAVGAGEGE